MYEEAQAVLDEFSARCNVSFTKAFSRHDRYEYRHTTIQNIHYEPLTVLVTWPSDRGLVQMGLDLKPFLDEFRPRFAAMTGICAGDRKKVKLGDLIVAECASLCIILYFGRLWKEVASTGSDEISSTVEDTQRSLKPPGSKNLPPATGGLYLNADQGRGGELSQTHDLPCRSPAGVALQSSFLIILHEALRQTQPRDARRIKELPTAAQRDKAVQG
jgi:hypothetical protein